VGEAEDNLVSMFSAIRSEQGPVLLILDGLEHILTGDLLVPGQSSMREAVSNTLRRSHVTFLTLLDSVRRAAKPGSNVLVVCTSTRESDSLCARFDCVFHLGPPNDAERRVLFKSIFLPGSAKELSLASTIQEVETLLTDLVETTIGKTYAELIQYCRQALEDLAREDEVFRSSHWPVTKALVALKERLQTSTPESLKSGVLADSVDMRILTARDLYLMNPSSSDISLNASYAFPMKGASAAKAWADLEATIIVPLCRSKELQDLLFRDGGTENKAVIGGILLTGEPGSGKSEIAMHCARYASYMLPTVKTLDVSCTSLIHMEVGGSERAVKLLFDSARKAAPCILLLDGIENIAAVCL
jgi:SpoVK/Ycf46/Vps4 family AAA+-type ATPase